MDKFRQKFFLILSFLLFYTNKIHAQNLPTYNLISADNNLHISSPDQGMYGICGSISLTTLYNYQFKKIHGQFREPLFLWKLIASIYQDRNQTFLEGAPLSDIFNKIILQTCHKNYYESYFDQLLKTLQLIKTDFSLAPQKEDSHKKLIDFLSIWMNFLRDVKIEKLFPTTKNISIPEKHLKAFQEIHSELADISTWLKISALIELSFSQNYIVSPIIQNFLLNWQNSYRNLFRNNNPSIIISMLINNIGKNQSDPRCQLKENELKTFQQFWSIYPLKQVGTKSFSMGDWINLLDQLKKNKSLAVINLCGENLEGFKSTYQSGLSGQFNTDQSNSCQVGHAVLLIGGRIKNNHQQLLIRNSWPMNSAQLSKSDCLCWDSKINNSIECPTNAKHEIVPLACWMNFDHIQKISFMIGYLKE